MSLENVDDTKGGSDCDSNRCLLRESCNRWRRYHNVTWWDITWQAPNLICPFEPSDDPFSMDLKNCYDLTPDGEWVHPSNQRLTWLGLEVTDDDLSDRHRLDTSG